MGTEHLCMHMGKTTGDCTPVQLDEDIWVQTVMHGPGNNPKPIKIVNRSIIYRLRPQDGDPFLTVVNAMWCDRETGEPCASLAKLAEELDAPLRFILTPGGGHNLSLADYGRRFPEARVCIPAGRIERHNADLMKLPNVETYTADTVPSELAAAGLEVLLWEGFNEGPGAAKFQKFAGNKNYQLGDTQPQTFLHRPTGTISNGGHHMWYRGAGDGPVFEVPWVVGLMVRLFLGARFDYMQPGKISLDQNEGFSVSDRAKVQASAEKILNWKFDKMIDFHGGVDSHLTSGARALFEEALGPVVRGEWAQVPWHMPA